MDNPKLSPMSGPRVCGCKGIRSCRLCMATDAQEVFLAPKMTFNYCIHCSEAWQEEKTFKQEKCRETSKSQSPENAAALDKPGNCEIKAADLNDDASSDDTPGVNSFPEELQHFNTSIHLEASPRLGGVSRNVSSCSHNASSEVEPQVECFPEESQQLNTSVHPEAGPRLGGVSRDVSSCSHNASHKIDFERIVIIEDFVSEAEEADLDRAIAGTQFVNSQSGRRKQVYCSASLDVYVSSSISRSFTECCCHHSTPKSFSLSNQFSSPMYFCSQCNFRIFYPSSQRSASFCKNSTLHYHSLQATMKFNMAKILKLLEQDAVYEPILLSAQIMQEDFGPKVNFKKQKVRTANFTGLPSYSQFLYQRMKVHPHLSDFEPVELCNLEYCQHRGAHIDPHLDDDWLWGERLVTLNLLSDSVLTFTLDSAPDVTVRVPLLRRSLIVVAAAARYSWKHSILPGDVVGRRIAMTFRELSKEFRSGGSRGQQGAELLKLALTFSGSAVGS